MNVQLNESSTIISLTADAKGSGQPLIHFWSACVGAGRANEGLRAGWLEQLKLVQSNCGFRYCRFHGLFHDDMFVYRVADDGQVIFNFQYIDELFDRMLAIGVRPFVEFGFCPLPLATKAATVFWWKGNGSPPNDYAKWGDLISRTVRHWIDRYGEHEVRTWYFEVWNEPNLSPFFAGTKSQYFELYRVTVQAIKAIDVHLRVGGPATSNFVPDKRFAGEREDASAAQAVIHSADVDAMDWQPVWLADFLEFCRVEKLPVDFVSCHPYPTDWALDELEQTVKTTRSANATPQDLALLRRMVDASAFPGAEIHLTEWSSSPSPRDHTHDYPQAATFIIKANLESIGQVDSLSYWVFTDVFEEGGAGDRAFHGGFGMINYRGIVKPAFHAYRFLNALGDELIHQSSGGCVTRDRSTGKLAALAYHYPPEVTKSAPASFDSTAVAEQTLSQGKPGAFRLNLSGVKPNQSFRVEVLDRHHGNAIAAWQAMGEPPSPTMKQLEQLNHAAWATDVQIIYADGLGVLAHSLVLEPWAVALVQEWGDAR